MRREPYKAVPFETLLGETLVAVLGAEVDSEEVMFMTGTGRKFRMDHCQDCCETVQIVDVTGDIEDLIGPPLLLAEEAVNPGDAGEYGDTSTWTFYKLSTVKGDVTIRWKGESNGYYSEAVDFEEIGLPHEWR